MEIIANISLNLYSFTKQKQNVLNVTQKINTMLQKLNKLYAGNYLKEELSL